MTHEQARELLLELAYGELALDAAEEVARHAAECAACGHELQRITSTRALASALGGAAAPRSRRDPLVEAARRAVAARPERRWFVRPAALSVGAAAAVAVVAFGVTLQLTRPGAHRRGEEVIEVAPRTPENPSEFAAAPPASAAAPEAARAPAPQAKAPTAPTPAAPTLAVPSPRAMAPRAPAPQPPPAPQPAPSAVAVGETKRPAEAGLSSERDPRAAPSAVPAPAAGAPVTDPGQPRPARAPARSAAKGRASAEAEPAGTDGAAPGLVAEVERRRAAGELTEERRRLRCGDTLVERIALVASDGRVVHLTEHVEASTAEAWYDGAGRLRASRATGDGAPALPRAAPTLNALGTSCGW